MYGSDKLECYITEGWRGFQLTNTLANWSYIQRTLDTHVTIPLDYKTSIAQNPRPQNPKHLTPWLQALKP
jgi:hypothetical protein